MIVAVVLLLHALTTSFTVALVIISCTKGRGQTTGEEKPTPPKVKGNAETVDPKELAKSKKEEDGTSPAAASPVRGKKDKVDTCPSTDLETLECFKDGKKPPAGGAQPTLPHDSEHGDIPKVVLSSQLPVGGDKRINKGGGICVDKDGNPMSAFAVPKY